MKEKKRNILTIILGLLCIFTLAMVDITEYGTLTKGFAGMVLLLLGSVIYPSALELIKERRKK